MARSIGSSKLTSTWRSSSSSFSLLLSVQLTNFDLLAPVLTDHPRIFPFFNYPSLPNATQPDCGIIKSDNFFLIFPLFGFYSGEEITDKNFWSCQFELSKIIGRGEILVTTKVLVTFRCFFYR